MILKNRLSAFVKLGVFLNEQLRSENAEIRDVLTRANQENPWFTEDNIRFALNGVISDLNEKKLDEWTEHYSNMRWGTTCCAPEPKTIAVVMPGNIPLVGFRDFLAVLISGHKILCKLSSKDTILLRYLAKKLIEIEPKFAEQICFENSIIKGFDAVIATGGQHAVEHFFQYFQNYPHIIRGHRNSCAILEGTENTDDLRGLFEDMFLYFGLGCRNVTKLLVPKNYDFQQLLSAGANNYSPLQQRLEQHHLYQNNLQYQQVVSALNNRKTIDAGVFTLVENSSLIPPISVVHYEYYSDLSTVRKNLETQKNQIQCIVSSQERTLSGVEMSALPVQTSTSVPKYVSKIDTPFGNAQKPTLFDYADGIDTMEFLNNVALRLRSGLGC